MRRLVPLLLLLAGVIHLLPVAGVLGAPQLQRLYGVAIDDPNLLILLQHRAVLFAIVGGLLLAAAFKSAWRGLAIAAGLVSVGSFLLLAWQIGGYNTHIARVVWADVAALVLLLLAAVLVARKA